MLQARSSSQQAGREREILTLWLDAADCALPYNHLVHPHGSPAPLRSGVLHADDLRRDTGHQPSGYPRSASRHAPDHRRSDRKVTPRRGALALATAVLLAGCGHQAAFGSADQPAVRAAAVLGAARSVMTRLRSYAFVFTERTVSPEATTVVTGRARSAVATGSPGHSAPAADPSPCCRRQRCPM